ncbi:MAG: hypothetical protein IKO41_21475 [Lachnospiraceae bacterium]|nr:hypothetical protein [Lachnospiraceae bacterium]
MAKKIMYMTELPESGRSKLEEISKYEMPKIDEAFKGRLKMLSDRYDAILKGKGNFVDLAMKCVDSINADLERSKGSEDCKPIYTLLPLNFVLWLYYLGCKQAERRALFEGLTVSIHRIQKYKGHEDLTMSFSDMPLTNTAKELMGRSWRKLMPKAMDNGYMHLQALITALVCSARGRAYPVEDTIFNALNRAVPSVANILRGIPYLQTETGMEYRRVYLNSYTEWNPLWRAVLFQVADDAIAKLLVNNLLMKAATTLYSQHPMKTNQVTREVFITKLCVYMQMSSFHEARRTMGFIAMNGRHRFW